MSRFPFACLTLTCRLIPCHVLVRLVRALLPSFTSNKYWGHKNLYQSYKRVGAIRSVMDFWSSFSWDYSRCPWFILICICAYVYHMCIIYIYMCPYTAAQVCSSLTTHHRSEKPWEPVPVPLSCRMRQSDRRQERRFSARRRKRRKTFGPRQWCL